MSGRLWLRPLWRTEPVRESRCSEASRLDRPREQSSGVRVRGVNVGVSVWRRQPEQNIPGDLAGRWLDFVSGFPAHCLAPSATLPVSPLSWWAQLPS